MTPASVILKLAAVGLALLVVAQLGESNHLSRVCYSRRVYYVSTRRVYYYNQYYYTWCWSGWRGFRCRRSRRVAQYYRSYSPRYSSSAQCCAGFSGYPGCQPVCRYSCLNGGSCTDPNTCSCPSTWTGSRCQTDVDECALRRDNCQDNCINTAGSFRCSCRSGYRLSTNGYSCNDINECTAGSHQCDQSCANTDGGYNCSCGPGWTLSTNGRSCNDVPECTLGTDNCQQVCVEQPGTFSCACNPGYSLQPDGRTCADIDECATRTDQCDQNCHNNVGSYTCSCNTGYRLAPDGRSCLNIDECAENTDGCEHNCHDTIGSYYCSCNTGYRLDSNQRSCNDIDECAENTDGCSQQCTNSIGSYVCSCDPGYRLDADRHTCNDINECVEGIDACAQNCHNNIGSYTCSCNTGYRLAGDGFACDDINECAEGSHECTQNCHNNVGSYTCSCNTGYRLNPNGRQCDDIDECAEGSDQCEHNCHNNVGSYTCSCRIGYRLNADGRACDDINECQEPMGSPDLHQCDQGCHNNIGSYTCSCGVGYVLDPDGRGCNDIDECLLDIDGCDHICDNNIGSYVCSCDTGWRLNPDQHTCSDIDECQEPMESPDLHQCDQNCHNNIGSYTCTCNIGWTLDFDGRRCNDVDECLPNGIGRHGDLACQQDCVNTPGSYHCACRTGFNITADGVTCEDFDECSEPANSPDKDECGPNSNCINNVGSYSCSCFNGYIILPDGRKCQDVDECLEGMPCGQGAECTNTPGSYTCTCPSGTMQNVDGTRCNDFNECEDGSHLCEHDCMNTVGSYTCFCSDSHTNADDGINCLAPPSNYQVTYGGSRSIVVTWNAPHSSDGNVMQYTIIVQSPDDPSFFRQRDIVDSNAIQYIVDGVTPATTYECCLTVRTDLGDSPFSCASNTTNEDTPDTPPSDVSTDLNDPYRIIVRWGPPTHPSGVITGYTIYVDYRNGSIVPIQLETAARSYEIKRLRPYQTILVAMSANTTVGEGVVSGYLSYTTNQAPPPAPEATFSVLNDRSFRVVWTAPSPTNGVLTQYFVVITNVRTGYRRTFTKQSTDFDLSVTIDNLTPFVPYTVEVSAATEAGTGEPKTLIVYTKQGIPVQPQITAAPRVNGENAVITLQPISPDDAHGYLTRVEVAYKEATSRDDDCSGFNPSEVDSNSVLVIEEDLDDSEYSLPGLDAGHQYCVAVRASTALGSSDYSDTFKITLSNPIPVQVRFTLTGDQQCGTYVADRSDEKIQDINQAIADYVVDSCQCNGFSQEYLTDTMLDCVKPDSNEFIYKGNVLATNELDSTEIRDTHIQGFVDKAPVVPVLGVSFKVNPYCNTTINSLEPGNTLCLAQSPTNAPGDAAGSNTIILALQIVGGVAGAALLSLIVFVPVCIACCCCARQDVKNKREGMNVRDQMVGRDINRRSGVPERPLLTNAGGMSTLPRKPPGNTSTLTRSTLTRKPPGNTSTLPRGTQSGYEPMGTLQRTTMPRGHKPVSDFDPDYEPVEDDDAVRKIDLGSQGTRGFNNPSYGD